MTTYRAEELAQSGRMMTIFALYVSMTGDADFMVGHFDKAKALASWLVYRWNLSLEYPGDDARYGVRFRQKFTPRMPHFLTSYTVNCVQTLKVRHPAGWR
jgi:hypothetical protein